MSERRRDDRRHNPAVAEPLERKRERRRGDRRESSRKEARFVWVSGTSRLDVEGEIGLGGASFASTAATGLGVVELRVGRKTLQFPGRVLKAGPPVHVTFDALDAATELALAKWLDGVE